MMGKLPEFMALTIGQHVYRNRYPDVCSFRFHQSARRMVVAKLNLFICKEQFDDLQSRILNNEFDPLTPCCIAMSDGINWVFRGYPIVIAYEEDDIQDEVKCVFVKLRYPVRDLKRIKMSGTDEKNN